MSSKIDTVTQLHTTTTTLFRFMRWANRLFWAGIVALLLLLTCAAIAQAGPVEWFRDVSGIDNAAAQIERAENIGLFAAGAGAVGVLWYAVAFILRHWKKILIVCAVLGAVSLVIIAVGVVL